VKLQLALRKPVAFVLGCLLGEVPESWHQHFNSSPAAPLSNRAGLICGGYIWQHQLCRNDADNLDYATGILHIVVAAYSPSLIYAPIKWPSTIRRQILVVKSGLQRLFLCISLVFAGGLSAPSRSVSSGQIEEDGKC
jgi:hypothetical protein